MGRTQIITGATEWGWHGHQCLSQWTFACLPQSQVVSVLPQLVSESCPRLTFLKLSDCHNVTADTLVTLAKACCQLHSLDLQHSMVSPVSQVALKKPGPK
jgi:hypothetical protein